MIFIFTGRRVRLLAIETSTPAASVAVIEEYVGECAVERNGRSDGLAPDGRVWLRPLKPGRPQTETLLETIDHVLAECGRSVRELDGFAVAVGPGAFIGVRVGIATVKGLAMGTGKPVVAVSTLDGLAWRALEPPLFEAARAERSSETPDLPDTPPDTLQDTPQDTPQDTMTQLTICPMIDARRGEVYTACYQLDAGRKDLIKQDEPRLTSPEELLDQLSGPVLFLGDGARLHRPVIVDRLGPRALFPPVARPELPDMPDMMDPSAAAVARLALREWRAGRAGDPGELAAMYLRPAVAPAKVACTARDDDHQDSQ
jgi:tRNA threonylcarbamoyladenosine biosynthesis protein TsaB